MNAQNMLHLSGQKFNRILVIRPNGKKGRFIAYECLCDCGTVFTTRGSDIKSGSAKSCGCLTKELSRQRLIAQTTIHGMTGTLTYQSWMAMMTRCYNTLHDSYPTYGGAGVYVCEFIRATPLNLLLLIGERPEAGKSLDRIKNEFGYTCGTCAQCCYKGDPMNVCWATAKEQCRKRTNNRIFTVDGQSKCVAEWSEITGLNQIRMYKWGEEKAVIRIKKALKIKDSLDYAI